MGQPSKFTKGSWCVVILSLPKNEAQASKISYLKRIKFAHNYYVYIVQCNDGFYYTGMTNDLERRLYEHNEGLVPTCFTYKRRPVILKHFEHYTEVTQAIERETQVKGWSRAKKEALFAQDFDLLKALAKCKEEKKKVEDVSGPALYSSKDYLKSNNP